MVGLGGGVFVVPVLAVALGIDLKVAIAASAICVVLNSLRGSGAYLRRGLVDMKLALVLQVSTASFAILGGLAVVYLPVSVLELIFAAMLSVVIVFMALNPGPIRPVQTGADPYGLKRSFRRPSTGASVRYIPQHVHFGVGLSAAAGLMSGMLGIGGGAVQVPIMNSVMRVPLRVAIATSTFMVGITATVSALIYAGAGLVDVGVTVPAMLGIVVGSEVGCRLGTSVSVSALRWVLIVVLAVLTVGLLL